LIIQFYGCTHLENSLNVESKKNNSLAFPGYEKLSPADQQRADSLLATALDQEALYSLLADLKPVSSIGFPLSYPIGKDSLHTDGQNKVVNTSADSIQHFLEEIESWNRVLDALSFDHFEFMLIPFKNVWESDRNMQILVSRTDLVDSLLVAQAPFFAQWGFVPGTDPAVLLTATEYESRNDRYRAYGYLFGYPEHAVDFFVNASIHQEATDEFVKRSFFHIPVHVRDQGYFTYALPEDFTPLASDSARYRAATKVLERYRNIRPKYVNESGQLNALQLLREWWAEENR
jgi:hypothetical protein